MASVLKLGLCMLSKLTAPICWMAVPDTKRSETVPEQTF